MSAPPPELSVIVVTWNGWALLERCLESVDRATAAPRRIEVVVVDNASTDGTDARLRQRFPAARYLRLPENRGFAAANNHAVASATGELIFLLNNDAVLAPDALDALVAAAREHGEFDIFAPEMLRMDAPAVVDNRGIFLDRTGHFRQIDSGGRAGDARGFSEIFGASGGACLIRRTVIDRCGLFDEALESYLEDCDFACRARAAGHRCLYVPSARVLHEGSATANRIPDRKLYLIQRNMVLLQQRWLPFRPWRLTSWLGVAYEAYQIARAKFEGRTRAVLRAKWGALRPGAPARPALGRTARRELARWVGVRARPVGRATSPGSGRTAWAPRGAL